MAIFVYLRFRLAETADIQDFEGDMRAMAELAETQPGYVWSEMGRSMQDQPVYLVLSEWDDIDDVRAWEHNGVHVEVQHKWEPHLQEPLVHRRFTPWERHFPIVVWDAILPAPPWSPMKGRLTPEQTPHRVPP